VDALLDQEIDDFPEGRLVTRSSGVNGVITAGMMPRISFAIPIPLCLRAVDAPAAAAISPPQANPRRSIVLWFHDVTAPVLECQLHPGGAGTRRMSAPGSKRPDDAAPVAASTRTRTTVPETPDPLETRRGDIVGQPLQHARVAILPQDHRLERSADHALRKLWAFRTRGCAGRGCVRS